MFKKIGAFLLLLLFLFIATPVQFWHNHSRVSLPAAKAGSRDTAPVIKDDCKICTHAYSVYFSDIIFPEIISISCYNIFVQSNQRNFYAASLPGLINKGPPQV